jgi:formylglycine-generating enzyme required for sulfatase activity
MRRGVVIGFLAALALGWGGHRVFQRLENVARKVPTFAKASAGEPTIGAAPAPSLPRELRRGFAWIPPGPRPLGDPGSGAAAREVVLTGFWLGRTEVTCEAFAEFLNETRNETFASPQFVREGGAWQPIRPAVAVAHVSLAQARAFAQWFGARRGASARLPTADEWEAAARGGIADAPYAWGWGDPAGRADFAGPAAARTALYAANGFGLFDCSGGVAEWCEPAADAPDGKAPALGGSWGDRDPAALQPGRRALLDAAYRDADVGFRILLESVRAP